MQQRYGLQERMGFSLARPSSGHAKPDVPPGTKPVSQLRREILPRVEVIPSRVPVMDTHRRPLILKASERACLPLKQGKARPHWNKPGIFCIILNHDVQPDKQQLHRFQPEKGGIRKSYGGSMGLVRHIKYGLTYIGGTGKQVTQSARVEAGTQVENGPAAYKGKREITPILGFFAAPAGLFPSQSRGLCNPDQNRVENTKVCWDRQTAFLPALVGRGLLPI